MLIKFKNNQKIDKSVIVIGNFDGVHIGHKFLIKKMKTISSKMNLKSILITFDPHTRHITNSNNRSLKLITDSNYKIELLQNLKVDYISVIDFDLEFSKITYETFIDQIVLKYNPKVILLGYDNKFGFKGLGNYKTILDHINKKSYTVEVQQLDKFIYNDKIIKSSLLKKYILEGNIKVVNELLERKFKIYGKVIKGKKIGNLLGFPTANLLLGNKQQIIPKVGVYYVNFKVGKDNYKSLCNIGYRPTFEKDKKLSIETHILNKKNIDLYGKFVEIEFLDFIREEKEFRNKELLINQINKDISLVNKN